MQKTAFITGIALVASILTIFVFLTGITSLSELKGGRERKLNVMPIALQNKRSGEASLKMLTDFHGYNFTLKKIHEAGEPEVHGHSSLWMADMRRSLRHLGVSYGWKDDFADARSFIEFAKKKIMAGQPVLTGFKIYPNEHPEWANDYFGVIFGVDDGGFHFHSTIAAVPTQYRTFEALSSAEHGLSFYNVQGYYFALTLSDQ
ncbi:MAG: hypothetical protein ACRBB0_26880 [Pelagimonas sp.]|uniref:hypothetical protein n=1 Tax=Pelagimonas sp. TaxID=2073170 RepID=UPI003D6BC16A